MKDIVARKKFKDSAVLERVVRYLFDNIGNLTSVRDTATLKRELAPLMAIRDHHPKTLITLDNSLPASHDGIRQVNAFDFLHQATE
jgi:predicted AAA+ superfamily ATPase